MLSAKLKKLIPQVKKDIYSFLSEEDGRITKQALLTVGSLLGFGALATIIGSNPVMASHSNSMTLAHTGTYASGTHQHHSTHNTHSTHATHHTHDTHSTHTTHATHATHATHTTHATHATHNTTIIG